MEKITKIDENTLEVETVVKTKVFKDHLIAEKERNESRGLEIDTLLNEFDK